MVLLYAAFLYLFEFIYKIIEIICKNIRLLQNIVVYLYYQRNTNTLFNY